MNVIEEGHNFAELDEIAGRAALGLEKARRGERDAVEGWLEYGAALNEGRKRFDEEDDKGFGQWVEKNLLLQVATVTRNERAAAMWAAKNPDELAEMQAEYPNVRTVRGWYDKHKDRDKPDNYRTITNGENEWYTPEEYIEKARRVMGGIDLDPASCAEANETVRADKFYTAEDNGLDRVWSGKVWLNPPYSRDLMPKFVEKLIASRPYVTAAIMVSHNNTDTQWFHSIYNAASAFCFVKKRIKFYRGVDVAAPVNGQVFIYIGNDFPAFVREFQDVGSILVPYE